MTVTFCETPSSLQMQMNIFFDELDNVNYQYEAARLKSFINWPVTYIKPERFAAAGFYFTGKGDSVKCFDCHLELYNWMEGDDPMMDHRRLSPKCRFIFNVPCDDVSIDFGLNTILSLTKEDTSASGSYNMEREWFTVELKKAKYPYYSSYYLRFDTFKNWPALKTQTKKQLAEAGFFYTNTNDSVLCFYCGLGLKRDWKDNEDPWKMHIIWMPKCFYLLEIKCQEYVDEILEKCHLLRISAETQPSQNTEATLESIIEENSAPNSGTSNIHSDVESISSGISALSVGDKSNTAKSSHIETDNFTSSTKLLCHLCYAKPRSTLFMPCQHLVACDECSKELKDICPICRKRITDIWPVHIP